jgi:hypothetical protein
MKVSAAALALGATATAFGQDTTTNTTDLFASLGFLGPILAVILIAVWIQWGGLKLFTGD